MCYHFVLVFLQRGIRAVPQVRRAGSRDAGLFVKKTVFALILQGFFGQSVR
jgi:hypothetical protein